MWYYYVFPLLVALIAALTQFHRVIPLEPVKFQDGANFPTLPLRTSANTISDAEKERYHRDGFILKKNLVRGDALAGLISGGEYIHSSTLLTDKIFEKIFKKLRFDLWKNDERFTQLAFESDFPIIAADLLGMIPLSETVEREEPEMSSSSVRILKDGFFGFMPTNRGCGFHVDDKGFWPATDESTGVNFWLALSPMRIEEGGGIRVVNRSLVEPAFLEKCQEVISKDVFPPQTCNMETLSPTCHNRMLKASVVHDMEPGDVLIWDRWTFHSSEPFKTKDIVSTAEQPLEEEKKMRYTIRYIPGSAKADGRIADELQQLGEVFNSSHYPKVWPKAVESEINAIQRGLREKNIFVTMLKSTLKRIFAKKDTEGQTATY